MKPLIIGNWKCNPITLEKAKELFNSTKKEIGHLKNTEVVICPPFIYLSELKKDEPKLKLGAQNCFWENSGAFTGEISPLMLKNLSCQYVILGHSERRQYLKETGEIINKKFQAALQAGLKPILCLGETKTERKEGKTESVLKQQLRESLKEVSSSKLQASGLILVYEPVWAISTQNGMAASPVDAKQALILIRKILDEFYSGKVKILYGGSVDSSNAKDYIQTGFDGLLVGNASLKAKEFTKIIKSIEKNK